MKSYKAEPRHLITVEILGHFVPLRDVPLGPKQTFSEHAHSPARQKQSLQPFLFDSPAAQTLSADVHSMMKQSDIRTVNRSIVLGITSNKFSFVLTCAFIDSFQLRLRCENVHLETLITISNQGM